MKVCGNRSVSNQILLKGEAKTVWNEITNVRLQCSKFPVLLSLLGIPKPLSAKVVNEGIGGYREAFFEGDALFRQEIIEWELHANYRFKFNASKNFTIGPVLNLSSGPFEICTGGYTLEKKGEDLLLTLCSEYELHGLMGKIFHWPFRGIISAFQSYLLHAIKQNLKQ
jgi:hypothetical protein